MPSLGSIFYALGVDVSGMNRAANNILNFARTTAQGQTNANKFSQSLRNLESAAVLAVGPLSGIGARIRSFNYLMGSANLQAQAFAAGIVGAGFALFKLGQAAISAELRLTAIQQRLFLLNGSTAAARVEFERLITVAEKSGQDFSQLAASYTRFAAAAVGTRLEGDKAREIFEQIAVTAGNLSLKTEEVEGAMKAFEQMMSKGTVQAEELRGQLGDRLFGAFNAAAKAMGVTTRELNKMVRDGKVVSDEFLPKFIKAYAEAFGIDTTKRVDNLVASQNRLSTAWLLFSKRLDETLGISSAYKAFLDALTAGLNALARNMDQVVRIAQILTGALLGMMAHRVIFALGTGVALIVKMTIAMRALNLAMLANPALSLVQILIRLGLALAGAAAAAQLFAAATGQAEYDQLIAEIDEYLDSEQSLRKSFRTTTDALIQQVKAQIEISKVRLEAFRRDAEKMADLAPNASMQAENIAAWQNIWDTVVGWVTGTVTPQEAAEGVKVVSDQIDGLTAALKRLEDAGKTQDKAPDDKTEDPTSPFSESKLRRLERTTHEMEKLRAEVKAMETSPRAMREFTSEFEKEDRILQFKQSLEQVGLTQAEINARTAEFAALWDRKIELGPIADGLRELEDVFVGVFSSISQTIAQSMLEGKLAIQDFTDIGKKFLEQLIAKLIELSIFNPLLNALLGTQQPVLGGMLGNIGNIFGGAFAKGGILGGPSLISRGGKIYQAGEKGKEGVLPLTRTPSGDLGVKALGGGGNPVVVQTSINIVNESKSQVDAKQNPSGGFDIRVFDQMTAGVLRKKGSASDKALGQRNMTIRRGA